jgi:Cu/Ag efflux protein CusF
VDDQVSIGRSITLAAILLAAAPALAQPPATAPALAQQPATEAAPAATASVVRITAWVEGVDAENRSITLKGPRGRVVTLPVGPEVPNLEAVRPGDPVVVRYLEALALDLRRAGTGFRERTDAAGAAPKPGERPAADARQVTAVAELVGVDPRRQVASMRVARRTVDVRVRDATQLKLLKVGDPVEVTYTEAAVIAIEPAPKAARLTPLGG